jgi:hypothetical protein
MACAPLIIPTAFRDVKTPRARNQPKGATLGNRISIGKVQFSLPSVGQHARFRRACFWIRLPGNKYLFLSCALVFEDEAGDFDTLFAFSFMYYLFVYLDELAFAIR